jgi:fructose-specific phosphotransferase system IIA component
MTFMYDSVAMGILVLQLFILFFAVRACGHIAKKIGVPPYMGELIAGVIAGPSVLGEIIEPGFVGGLFRLSNELYAIALIAAVIFLFVSGLRTNIDLFFRYSLAGSIIGPVAAVISFVLGNLAGCFLLESNFFSPQCLFLGTISMTASGSLTARILSNNKKMNSPEGVAILTSTVFIDILAVIAFALVSVIIMVGSGWSLDAGAESIILIIAVTGAYIAGLSLSGSRHATVIQERLQRIYELLVPALFALIGMMVNVRDMFASSSFGFGILFSLVIVFAKIVGGGGPALLLGFNFRGSLRVGAGIIPHGELALLIAAAAVIQGIFSQQFFSAVILMTIVTAVIAAVLQNFSLKRAGLGTRRPIKGDDSVPAVWKFLSPEIKSHVLNVFLEELRAGDFYVHIIDIQNGFFQARKSDIALSVMVEAKSFTVETDRTDMPFVKTAVFEATNSLHKSIQDLVEASDLGAANNGMPLSGSGDDVFSLITPDCISVALKGNSKKEIIAELVDLLASRRKLLDRDLVLHDILEREKTMSTGMQHSIALPHAKTDGVNALAIAIGIKKEGIDFESIDGSKTKLVILMVSSKKTSGPHVQFLASISALLKNDELREAVINAQTPEEVSRLLRTRD